MTWLLLLIFVLVVVAIVVMFVVYLKPGTGTTPTTFSLDYGNVAAPLAGVFDGTLVKPAINPVDLLVMYTDDVQVSDGDVLQLRNANGAVVQEKRLSFNNVTGVGDWSLLFNLREELYTAGLMANGYTLALVRNGSTILSQPLSPNIVEIEWFSSDVRLMYPGLIQGPLILLGDLLFVADVNPNGDRILRYLFYCSDDRTNTFTLHDASPMKDTISPVTYAEIRDTFRRKFIGLTNYQVDEITYWEPMPPMPPTSPIVINTSAPYPATFNGVPVANNPGLLDLSKGSTVVQNGSTVQISRSGVVYYQVRNVQLDNVSTEELSPDYKYLLSGLYSLIETEFLRTGDFVLQIVAPDSTLVQASAVIPKNVSGIKMFDDQRLTTPALGNSFVTSDVAKVTPRPETGPNYATDVWWCANGQAKTFTNGSFVGVLKDVFAYYQQQYPNLNSIKVELCNSIDPTVYTTIST